MSSSTDRFKHESVVDPDSIIKYFQSLIEGFQKGALLFCSDGRRLVIKPQGLISLEIEAKNKGGQNKMTLKFRWTEEHKDNNENTPLTIEPIPIN